MVLIRSACRFSLAARWASLRIICSSWFKKFFTDNTSTREAFYEVIFCDNLAVLLLLGIDTYRKSFGVAYETVVRIIQDNLKLEATGRPAKSTTSIVDKLHRESIRLSQLQDIAGCRIVIENIQEQDSVVSQIRNAFSLVSLVDRRIKPNYGYRAVHLIIKIDEKLVEVQVRTILQHNWAELSEKLSDKIDPSIKYGGGNKMTQELLLKMSRNFEHYEKIEIDMTNTFQDVTEESQKKVLKNQRDEMEKLKQEMIKLTKSLI